MSAVLYQMYVLMVSAITLRVVTSVNVTVVMNSVPTEHLVKVIFTACSVICPYHIKLKMSLHNHLWVWEL